MRWLVRFLIALILLVVVIGGVLGFVVNRWMYGPIPQHDGEITVDGLNGTVTILRDDWGVPHIYASSSHDLFFAQGYTQAQDRWWQMEFFRAIGRGELQELTGRNPSVMGQDVFIRTVGWLQSARHDLEAMDTQTQAYVQAFADGVNAYISSRPASELAFEYNILGVTGVTIPIEPWLPEDTLVWTKVMAWDLGGNWDAELFLSDLLGELDEEMVADYDPEWPFGLKPTIIQPEDLPGEGETFSDQVMNWNGITGLDAQLVSNIAPGANFVFGEGEGIGSNDWVVNGEKSATGLPLLADDPHLGIQMPSIWYEVGLHCQPVTVECPFNVVGLAFSPAPTVVLGHNDNIGWGVTNVGWDTQDLYMLEINPDDPLQYRWNGEWRDMTVREEEIRFGDSEETVTIQVRETHLGPIITDNDVDDDGNVSGFNNDEAMALHWTSYETGTIVSSLFALNQASNWDEFRDALRMWDAPSQNFVYADVEGNIGYQTPGRIPVRAAGHTGMLPVDGTTDENEWLGYLPFDYLPSVLNPDRNYIATANQALVPLAYYDQLAQELSDQFGEDANYVFGYRWAQGYRAERIVEMLQASNSHDFDTYQAIHGDNKLIFAEEIAPYVADVTFEDDTLTEARDWMLNWDYQMHMNSPQAALFAQFYVALADDLYNDQLGDVATANNRQMWATTLLMADPENVWWDDINTPETETRDDIIQRAFGEAYQATIDALGENREEWAWGTLHTATFASNPLGASGIDLLEGMVNRGPVATSGGSNIVNATGWSGANNGNFTVRAVPSMRMILDFSDLSKSVIMHTTGQSGHPFSDQYGQMVDPWRFIEYHPMLWTQDQVEAAAVSTLTLNP